MAERRPANETDPPAPPAEDSSYTEEEEAEVQKRLEDLGYVEQLVHPIAAFGSLLDAALCDLTGA